MQYVLTNNVGGYYVTTNKVTSEKYYAKSFRSFSQAEEFIKSKSLVGFTPEEYEF